ncbi:cupin domain-containing protein [Phyllobacterium sp. LjRoot231]|uniref:cupin domain-containing protein n=1 Tax=Phyllobacterium sp. LjRoot231 TaxID=3342289 RepID=UPI003ED048AD
MSSVISIHPLADQADARELLTGDPFAETRMVAFSAEGKIAAGACSLASGAKGSARYPHHELIIIRGGNLVLDDGIRAVTLVQGSVAVIPQGITVTWSADSVVQWDFMTFSGAADPAAKEPGIVLFDLDVPRPPSASPSAELLISAEPQCQNRRWYADPSGQWTAGVWSSTSYHRRPMHYGYYEMMHMLEGRVEISNGSEQGTVWEPGETCLLPKGASLAWNSREDVLKIYGTWRPS